MSLESTKVPTVEASAKPSPFLAQLSEAAKRHGHEANAAEEIVQWCRRYILFHAKQHPQEMGRAEIGVFLDHHPL